jgi:arylsulfatase A-like enzyme
VPSKDFQGRSKAKLYGDFVQQVDASIGRIVDQLEKSGAASNTLLIVTSDNGAPWEKRDSDEAAGHWADRPWRGQKADIQEGGHRIPFLARWPGVVKAGSTSDQTICLTDIFATAAALTTTPMTSSMGEDSYSLLNVLNGSAKQSLREAIVHHSAQGLFSIRQGNWKLVLGRGSGGFTEPAKLQPAPGEPSGELYDLKTDPHEDQNLFSKRPQKAEELTSLLERYRRQGYSRPLV